MFLSYSCMLHIVFAIAAQSIDNCLCIHQFRTVMLLYIARNYLLNSMVSNLNRQNRKAAVMGCHSMILLNIQQNAILL